VLLVLFLIQAYALPMTATLVNVQGTGVAALCSRKLLNGQVCPIEAAAEPKSLRLPAILLSQSTQKLLIDIFCVPEFFAGMPHIRHRVVAWGSRESVVLPHDAVVISEDSLLARLNACLPGIPVGIADSEWSVLTSRSANGLPSLGAERRFGGGTAHVCSVDLTRNAEAETCWVESTGNGWLFLLTTGPGVGSLLSVGEDAESLLGQSRLIAGKINQIQPVGAEFPAYPRTLEQLCGPGWLACGSVAVAFDPLCGEGAGNAAREAILACAAIRAIQAGESPEAVMGEYATRLRLGFLRHLEQCREFYLQDPGTSFWRDALRRIDEGLAWTRGQLASAGAPKFQLVDFALKRFPE
jgi:hypothetical protein